MRDWNARHLAAAAHARLVRAASPPPDVPGPLPPPGPVGVSIDTRTLAPGELFVGLPGEHADGGAFAASALAAGAWGVLVEPEHARVALEGSDAGAVIAHGDPLVALQTLARAWRWELRSRGAMVVAITGSSGKTSTKDILAALMGERLRVAASEENFNTEIGLPLTLLRAPGETELLVLEMAMRGRGQIALLAAIAEPDVGVIVNVGPAHLELLGSLQEIAAAKAELIAGLAPGASIVVPEGETLLEEHLRADLRTITFGDDGDVLLEERRDDGSVLILDGDEEIELRPSFSQAYNLRNLLAAVAAARALGYTPRGRVDVRFSAMRGQREQLAGGVVLVADCYNANPMSMRAAIDDLAETSGARRVALLGDMLELGPHAPLMHREIGEHAASRGVELLVTVGPLARELRAGFAGESYEAPDAQAAGELLAGLLQEGDTVLVKASRGVGLEHALDPLRNATPRPRPAAEAGPNAEAGPDTGTAPDGDADAEHGDSASAGAAAAERR
jgi:UDP-N-acetylmuramoyl-tripeptide--D-alanyl-D-alanine ligase